MAEGRRFIVRGRVQGVAFRWFTRETARQLGLRGWVRNLPDGSVEARAEGTPAALDALASALAAGPGHARVEAVEADTIEAGSWTGFEIRPDG